MSGLARIARVAGAHITGSDIGDSETIAALRSEGIAVSLQQSSTSVPKDCDLLVVSAAIKNDHAEVVEAASRGIEILKYAQLLGRLMIGRRGIAVAGTHGKSSTTSMLSHILIQCQLDPSFIVGANCKQIGGGSRTTSSNSDLLVAEACEFDRSFHHFHHTLAAILNVEEDHMEVYGSLEAIIESFRTFASILPDESQGGFLLINHEMPCRLAICAGLNAKVQSIGFAPQADWRVVVNGSDNRTVKLHHKNQLLAQWDSPLPGDHMAYNSAVAAVLAHQAGAAWDDIAKAIAGFQGLDRRMQQLGDLQFKRDGKPAGKVAIVDDYGHHPTEVDTTLRALRNHYNPKRLICVFQPHQHSRTRFLMEQFAASFSAADIVIVPHIFFVRDSEEERRAVSAADLVDRLRHRKIRAMHLYPFDAIVEQLSVLCQDGDLVVTMGAGDVYKIGFGLLKSQD